MKIGDSISHFYRPKDRQQDAGGGVLSGLPGDASSGRTQSPTVSIGGGATSAFAGTLWLSQIGKLDEEGNSPALNAMASAKATSDEFMTWSDKSLPEKIRAQILKAKDLTEEGLAALKPDERLKIEAEIEQAIKEKLGVHETGVTQENAAAGPAP